MKTQMRVLVALVVVGGGTVLSRAAEEAKGELDGTWELLHIEQNGKEVVLQGVTKSIISGNEFVVWCDDKVIVAGSSKLDPTKTPKAVDITYTSGVNKGKTFLGIYQINGDKATFCRAGLPDDPRPTEFKTKPGSGQMLTVYQKGKH